MSHRKLIFAACALILLTCVAYFPVLNGSAGYVWDDSRHVTMNSALHDEQGLVDLWAWGPRAIFDRATKAATQQYYPVTFTSFWLEYQMWGLNPLGYHVTNVLLHLLSAFLLWVILRKVGVRDGIALFAAALFAVHPVNVESVAWISERKNTLSLVLYLGAALCWIQWNKLDAVRGGGGGGGAETRTETRDFAWLFWATLLFALALLAKSVTVTLPAALLALAWWKRGKVRRMDVVGVLPLLFLAIIFGAMTAFIEARYIGASGPDFDFGFAKRCLIAGRAPWFYVGKFLDPRHLVFIYPRWRLDPRSVVQWLPVAAAVAVVAGLFAARKRIGRGALASAILFILAVAPALGFVNFYPMEFSFVADHFQYMGMMVLCTAGAALLGMIGPRVSISSNVMPIAGAVILIMLSFLSYRQATHYREEETLYRATLAANPDAWMASENLAVLLIARDPEKNYAEVVRLYRQTLDKNPDDVKARNAYAASLLAMHHYAEAAKAYEDALQRSPKDGTLESGLGAAFLLQTKFDQAINHYAAAVALEPNDPESLAGYGNCLLHMGHPAEAETQFRAALALHSGAEGTYHYYLGLALRDRGLLGAAMEQFRAAIKLDPTRPEPFAETGDILARLHKDSMAVDYFQSALHVQHDYLPAQLALARLLLISDEPGRADPVWAADLFRQADEEIHEQNTSIKIEHAAALAEAHYYDEAVDVLQEALRVRGVTPEDRESILQLIQKYRAESLPAGNAGAGAPVSLPDETSIFHPYPSAAPDIHPPKLGYFAPP